MSSLARQLARETRLQLRYGIHLAGAAVVLTWAPVLLALAPESRAYLLPVLLVMDTAIFGFFLMPGMMFLEKAERVLSALVVTPMSARRYLTLKVAPLTVAAVVLAVAIVGVTHGFAVNWLPLLVGVAAASVMTMLAGFSLAARFASISQFLLPSVLVLTFVQLPALHYFELWPSYALYALPPMGALVLVKAGFVETPAWEYAYALVYTAATLAAVGLLARRTFDRVVAPGGGGGKSAEVAPPGPTRRRGWLGALVAADLRNLRRDPMMLFLAGYAVLLAVVGRWLVPWGIEQAADSFDLAPYTLLIITFLSVESGPLILGCVTGLLLLDERDEHSLTALQVTPLPLSYYGIYRALAPMIFSALICVIGVWFVGLVSLPTVPLLAVAVMVALEAPIAALALATFAPDKVTGLAMMKGLGAFLMAPVIAWFVAPPLRWILGILPTLWPAEAFWRAAEPERGSFWLIWLVGMVIHLALLWWLSQRFRARAA